MHIMRCNYVKEVTQMWTGNTENIGQIMVYGFIYIVNSHGAGEIVLGETKPVSYYYKKLRNKGTSDLLRYIILWGRRQNCGGVCNR